MIQVKAIVVEELRFPNRNPKTLRISSDFQRAVNDAMRQAALKADGEISFQSIFENEGSVYAAFEVVSNALPKRSEQLRVMDKVLAERDKQDARWGGPDHDDQHSQEYWGELIDEYLHGNSSRTERLLYNERMTKVAALALAALESNYRKKHINTVRLD